MKKPNYKKFFTGFFIVAVMSVIAACGGNNQNNQPPILPPAYVYPNCINCQNITGPLIFSGESSDYMGSLRVTWAFAGQNMPMAQTYPYASGMTSETYSGLVSTSGQMILNQNMNLGYCFIPAGSYSLMTAQAGRWGYGIVSNLALQAVGPTSVMLTFFGQVSASSYLTNGQLSTISASTGRMFGTLQVQSVNGQPCHQSIGLQ